MVLRDHPRHRERGPAVLVRVTYPAIAAAVGLSVETVKRDAVRRVFNPRDLGSVAVYITSRKKGAKRC